MQRLLRAAEAAERLQVTPKTLRSWADAGRVPYVLMPSGERRFRADEIDELLVDVPIKVSA